jgi:hypothetical protein
MSPEGYRQGESDSTQSFESVTRQFRSGIRAAMAGAARDAQRTIDTDKMVITTRDDIFIANAPITIPPDGASIFEYPMFVNLGFDGTACARNISSGFYTIRVVIDPETKVPMAHYIDKDGQTALVNPVTLETRPVLSPPDEEDPLKVGVTLRSVPEQVGRAGVIVVGTCRCVYSPPASWVVLHTVII